jgi:hypothetical protein
VGNKEIFTILNLEKETAFMNIHEYKYIYFYIYIYIHMYIWYKYVHEYVNTYIYLCILCQLQTSGMSRNNKDPGFRKKSGIDSCWKFEM